jgi:hypothetical protein
MPPRLSLRAHRVSFSVPVAHARITLRRWASSSASSPEVYDVVCVGGGPAGLSLLTGLRASPVTAGLKVALIEGQDLYKNKLEKDAPLESFSNRCSSLTPASVRNLRGTHHVQSIRSAIATEANELSEQKWEHGRMPTHHASNPTKRCKYGMAFPMPAYPSIGSLHARSFLRVNLRNPRR